MDIHFISGVVVAFLTGLCFGCVLLGTIAARVEKRRKLTQLSNKVDTFSLGMMNMVNRRALQKLESGDIEAVKQELSGLIANFYHTFKGSGDQMIAGERREIQSQAQSSAILAAALKQKSDEKATA